VLFYDEFLSYRTFASLDDKRLTFPELVIYSLAHSLATPGFRRKFFIGPLGTISLAGRCVSPIFPVHRAAYRPCPQRHSTVSVMYRRTFCDHLGFSPAARRGPAVFILLCTATSLVSLSRMLTINLFPLNSACWSDPPD